MDNLDHNAVLHAKPATPDRFRLCTPYNFGLSCAAGRSLPLKRVHVKCTLLDYLAEVSVEQTFQNDDHTAAALEVIYRFPLDTQAILTSFSVQKNDNVIIHGKIKEKEEAKATYDEALASGQGGYLLQEEGELKDVFSLKVGNLQAGETVKVKLTYVAQVDEEEEDDDDDDEEGGKVEGKNKNKNKNKKCALRLVIPTAVAPRYTPAMQQPPELYKHAEAALGSWPEDLLTIEGKISTASKITHLLPRTFKEKTNVSVREGGKEGSFHLVLPCMTEDFVLSVGLEERLQDRAWLEPSTGALTVSVGLREDQFSFSEESKGEFFFVIDRSGSMGGQKIQQAREALALCISALPEGSLFQILSFGSTFSPLFPATAPSSLPPSPVVQPPGLTSAFTAAATTPAAATAAATAAAAAVGTPVLFSDETKKTTLSHCEGMEADLGGTELLAPLRALAALPPSLPRQVFLITDGQVGNTGEVLGWVRREGRREGTRFFAVGIGSGVSRGLVKGVGREGGGESVFVVEGERMQGKVMRQMNRAVAPALTGGRVEVGGGREGGVGVLSVSPKRPRPLFTGARLLFYALLDPNTLVNKKSNIEGGKEGEEGWVDVGDEKEGGREEGLTVRVRGTGPGGEEVVIPVPVQIVPRGFSSSGMLRALAVKSVLTDLEEEVEGEEGGEGGGERKEKAKKEAIALSVGSGVLCKYTSYVAVEEGREGGKEGGPKQVFLPLAFVNRTNMGHDPWGRGRAGGGGGGMRGMGRMMMASCSSMPMPAMMMKRGGGGGGGGGGYQQLGVVLDCANMDEIMSLSQRDIMAPMACMQSMEQPVMMEASCDLSSAAPPSSAFPHRVQPGTSSSSSSNSSSSSSGKIDHVTLVARQKASGAWEWNEQLLSSILFAGGREGEREGEEGKQEALEEFEARMRAMKVGEGGREGGDEKDVWATALVLLYLEKEWGEYEEEWEAAAKKAKRWLLRSVGGGEEQVQDVMGEAGKALAQTVVV